jgi:hypothetical protein
MQPGPAATIACLGTVAVPSKKVPTHWVRSVIAGSEQASGVQSDSAEKDRMSTTCERLEDGIVRGVSSILCRGWWGGTPATLEVGEQHVKRGTAGGDRSLEIYSSFLLASGSAVAK